MQNRPYLCAGLFEDTAFDKKQNQTLLNSTNTTETKWIRSVMFGKNWTSSSVVFLDNDLSLHT